MKKLLTCLFLGLTLTSISYATEECAAKAAEKKLAGAAKNSFMKKCIADSQPASNPACDAKAKEKKLAGAAKNSFLKKCNADAMKPQ